MDMYVVAGCIWLHSVLVGQYDFLEDINNCLRCAFKCVMGCSAECDFHL